MASPKKPSPMKNILKTTSDISMYQRGLRRCFEDARKDGFPNFHRTSIEFNLRRQTLSRYYRVLEENGQSYKDFDQKFLDSHFRRGQPLYITPAQRDILFSAYKVLDGLNAPLFNCEIQNTVMKMRAESRCTPISDDIRPHHTTLKKIKCPPDLPREYHIPTRRGRPSKGSQMRIAKNQPQYLDSFYALLKEWMMKYEFQPSEM